MTDHAVECRYSDLITAVADCGDKKAFAELFAQFAPQLQAYALSKSGTGGSTAIANEVVQETMIRVWHRASLYNADRASLSDWIFSIARNTRIDILRRHAENQSTISADDLWPIAEDTESLAAFQQQRMKETIRDSLDSISGEQALVLRKMYLEGKSQREIADECGIPLSTVKSRVRLAMTRLKFISEDACA